MLALENDLKTFQGDRGGAGCIWALQVGDGIGASSLVVVKCVPPAQVKQGRVTLVVVNGQKGTLDIGVVMS